MILRPGISTRSNRWYQIEMPIPELIHLNVSHESRSFSITDPFTDVVRAFSETQHLEKISGERARLGAGTGRVMNVRPWSNTN